MSSLPELVSARLLLRQRSDQDMDGLMDMGLDPKVMQFIGDGPLPDPGEHREVLISRIERDYGEGLGYWSVFARTAPDVFLGWVYLKVLPRSTDIELGYRFRSSAWGQGYATEACKAVMGYAFCSLGLPEVLAVIDSDNAPSRRVTERLGFEFQGERHAYGRTHQLFRLTPAEKSTDGAFHQEMPHAFQNEARTTD